MPLFSFAAMRRRFWRALETWRLVAEAVETGCAVERIGTTRLTPAHARVESWTFAFLWDEGGLRVLR